MKAGKKRHPTRVNPVTGAKQRDSATDAFPRPPAPTKPAKRPLPDDIADAAEAALDDLIGRVSPTPPPLLPPEDDDLDEPRTATVGSEVSIEPIDILDDEEEDLQLTARPGRRRSNPAIATGRSNLAGPPTRESPVPSSRAYVARDSPMPFRPSPSKIARGDEPVRRDSPLPARQVMPPGMTEQVPTIAFTEPQRLGAEPVFEPERGSSALLDDIVEERSLGELPPLRFAVFEDASYLASAQGAIVAAGHVVAVGASGRDGLARVTTAIRSTTHAIDAVLVALPGGEPIIAAALALEPRRPVIIAALGGKSIDGVQKAIGAGADLVAQRPHDVDRLAPIVLAAGRIEAERRVTLAARATEQLLRAKVEELSDPDLRGLQPLQQFQQQLEREIKRAKRFEYQLSVALFAVEIAPPAPPPGILGILRARCGNALIHTIRDIDIATQVDHERFLVLLPYTDLKGAAGLARRVIAAVAAGDPVTAAGRSFPPRVVGAVAGAKPGEAVSFAKLMKDATHALNNARRDGAELAVQP